MKHSKPVGPFLPQADKPTVFCMAPDEPVMFRSEQRLNEKEKKELALMRYSILPWSMAFVALAGASDEVVLDEIFLSHRDLFDWHVTQYRAAGLSSTRRLHFSAPDAMYSRALSIPDKPVTCICFSYALNARQSIPRELELSQKVNSKIQLVTQAKRSTFQVPKSQVHPKRAISRELLEKEFSFPRKKVLIKTDGLGGGFNVKPVRTMSDLRKFLTHYPDSERFVIQEHVGDADEFSADFSAASDALEPLNVRMSLVADGQWFGNIYSPHIGLSASGYRNLLRCAKSVHQSGYRAESPMVFGIDFLQTPRSHYVLEVNARWTGGLPVSLLIERLGLSEQLIHSHFDQLPAAATKKYQRFCERYGLRSRNKKPFRIFPLGFGPKSDGDFNVFYFVTGDYEAFVKTHQAELGRDTLPFSQLVLSISQQKQIARRFKTQ